MTYTIFTYAMDEAALSVCIRQIRRVDSRAFVAIFDDATHPLTTRPDCDLYKLTDWPRGGNLVGMPCIIGMLSCYMEAIDAAGSDRIVKIDSDTMLLTIDGLKHADADAIGYESHETTMYAVGPCYSLARRAVMRVANYIYSRPWAAVRYPEDYTIFHIAMAVLRPDEWQLYPSPRGLIAGISTGDAEEAELLARSNLHFVHCGEPEIVKGQRRRRVRADVAKAMLNLETALTS